LAPFRREHDELQHGLVWRLMQNGPVTKYWQREIFDADIAELTALGVRVFRFDCAAWIDDDAMHDQLRNEFELPAYTGRNFDALADSLSDAPVPSEHGGVVVALDNYMASERNDALLRVLASASRWWLLFGRVFAAILRTDDPAYQGPANLGATPPLWNGREWLNAKRGL
jgi:RNAse (barnase) inhibitor barstar